MREPSKARSMELFFIDGKPDGMLTAEVFNWTGHVLVTPRTRLKEALARTECSYTGIYLLLGEENEELLLYVGEGENIANRIKNHDANKDWWTTCVMVTSQANNLHKAHVQYLESRLVEEAQIVGLAKLENGTQPKAPTLSEADISNMENFLEHLLMVLPAVRVDVFLRKTRPSSSPSEARDTYETVFELVLKKENITATAVLSDGEFVVQEGSMARNEWVGRRSEKSYYWRFHDDLVARKILVDDGDHKRFATNYAFSSTSAAGAVVNGRSTPGPKAWKVLGTGKTYKEWEAENLDSI
jgi:hypothetical protein